MSPLLGPILAQLVTLAVADRTEARYIVSDEKYAEAATSPRVGLSFGWQHTTLSLGYGASVTVTPLDSTPRDTLLFHSAAISAAHTWARTTAVLTESVGFGQVSFRVQALGAPTFTGLPNMTGTSTPTGTVNPPAGGTTGTTGTPGTTGTGTTAMPGASAANQIAASDQVIEYVSSSTDLVLTHVYSTVLSVQGGIGYSVAGSVGSEASAAYPVIKGPRAQVSASYRLDARDDVATSVGTQYAAASTGNDAWFAVASESWGHALDPHTNTRVGAGLSIARNSQPDGLVSYSVYPNFAAGLSYSARLARGTLSLGSGIAAAPYIDPVRALVDPRVSVGGSAGWGTGQFSSSLSGGTALSLTQSGSAGALNSASFSLGAAYRFGAALALDGGLRGFWQSFEGQTTVPVSYAVFLGVTVGLQAPLNGGR